ncbi:MAG: Hint domain-containing protein [Rhodobacter sp.]|uniref:Hint domain-containing protein n=1 Tax=Pararhodobacter sp. TaxID=2127056 RepID=UPI001D9C37EE|nr:Hint domain-containing protein [Pararhodobacter sp.]MCB1343711.1 Hint domain-containing protein [Paracoccaceae bacterium]MCC0072053.1 Hint domain-containing protein [Rhodobacter sp.]HPD92669.1 Hint domain-containing protein [Pararhodobacter sp.]
MSSVSGFSGVYAVEWAQTAPGEEWGLPPDLMAVGMSWRWRGTARRLDAGIATLWLDSPADRDDPRRRARDRMRRLALAAMPQAQSAPEPDTPADSMLLTDGRRIYPARIVRQGARLLAVFHPLLPPPDRELWVAGLSLVDATRAPRRAGVICFLPGTAIATPHGARAIETLAPGDRVLTRDNGPQPVVWRGETRLSGAELFLHPHLRPLRIRADALARGRPEGDLLISPGHRLLLRAPALLGEAEVLVAAEDLEDGRAIRRDFGIDSVRYIHLMLERHEIITANGQPCESFHPGMADPRVLAWHARSLERVAPGLASDPGRFGDPARRCLTRGEAGILAPSAA